ncbi:MAG TPA: type II secretion system F family protein [archaeon]|nr:type II secretion system F family protein [archaeon]
MYQFIYAISPKGYKKWIDRYLQYCDFKISTIRLIGFFFLFGLGLSFSVSFILFLLNYVDTLLFFVTWLGIFVTFEIATHGILVFIADSRANFVEEILPDALQIISANLRSGLTPDKAILTSARPEFGPLEKEMKFVAKETLSGRPLEESLKEIAKKINSKILDKTITLLIEGMAKGGSLTQLLDSISEDIRQIKILRREIKSYVMMYGIFIFFAIVIGAPLLYSVSTFLVETMSRFGSSIELQQLFESQSSLPIFKSTVTDVTPDFLILYSILSISVTAIFGSLLIGLIQEGSEKAGMKFIPLLLPLSLAVFFIARIALQNSFGTLIV